MEERIVRRMVIPSEEVRSSTIHCTFTFLWIIERGWGRKEVPGLGGGPEQAERPPWEGSGVVQGPTE